MKKEIKIILIIVIAILLLIGVMFLSNFALTGKTIEENSNYYTYTKAICDEKNYCEDYAIECEGEKKLAITPTGYAIQNPENWTDKREEEILCKN